MKFVREVESGNLMVNWDTQWRADLMPHGGVKESGMGKECPKYAVEEMTELKMAIFHLDSYAICDIIIPKRNGKLKTVKDLYLQAIHARSLQAFAPKLIE